MPPFAPPSGRGLTKGTCEVFGGKPNGHMRMLAGASQRLAKRHSATVRSPAPSHTQLPIINYVLRAHYTSYGYGIPVSSNYLHNAMHTAMQTATAPSALRFAPSETETETETNADR